MMSEKSKNSYQGVVVPVVTPLNQDQSIDVTGLRKLLQHMIRQNVDGIFLFGTSAEVTRLDGVDKNKILVAAMEECFGKVKTYMGILQSGLKRALADVEIAKTSGIDCLVVCPPYYYGVSSQETLEYFTAIAQTAAMPTMLYNIPQTTGNYIGDDVYEKIIKLENIVGVKDSCGQLAKLVHIIECYGSSKFSVFAGSEEISYEALKRGADGLVPSLGNAFPKLFTDFYQAGLAGNDVKAQYLNGLIREFNEIRTSSFSFLSPVATRKYALSVLDICQPWMSAPYLELDVETKHRIQQYIQKYSCDLVG